MANFFLLHSMILSKIENIKIKECRGCLDRLENQQAHICLEPDIDHYYIDQYYNKALLELLQEKSINYPIFWFLIHLNDEFFKLS